MSEYIGIKGFFIPDIESRELKRELLLFDQIGFLSLYSEALKTNELNDEIREKLREMEWLIKKKMIFEVSDSDNQSLTEEYENNVRLLAAQFLELTMELFKNNDSVNNLIKKDQETKELFDEIIDLYERGMKTKMKKLGFIVSVEKSNSETIEEFVYKAFSKANDFATRAASLKLQQTIGYNVFPILNNYISYNNIHNVGKSDVIQIVINFLPTPDDSISWEQIIEFKSDADSKSKFLALRNWTNEIAKGNLRINEIEEELEYLIDQYEKHLQFHKMKYHKGILETIVTTTAEVAENLVKLKFSKIAQLPFTIKNKKLALMEEEMKAPGREIAYISMTREKFP